MTPSLTSAERDRLKPYIPPGNRRLRVGTKLCKGDRFKNQDGHWTPTCDAGRKITKGYPCLEGQEKYAGIYIRRNK